MIQTERRVLDNGLRVICVQRPYVHTAAFGAFIRVGTRYEEPREQGLAHFLEHLLFRGSERLKDSVDLSREAERLGGIMDAWVHQEYTGYMIDLHRDHWRKGLELLGEVLLHPSFTDEQVSVEKAILLEEMAQWTDSQGETVNLHELVYSLMWGDGISQADVAILHRNLLAFDRNDVLDFYHRYYTAGNMAIVMAGDFDRDEAFDAANEMFGKLSGERKGTFRPATPFREQAASLVRYLEATQADLSLALRACSHRHADYPATVVLAEVLGGGTASRLFTNIREDQGLVYDIRADVATFHDVGAVTTTTTCTPQNLHRTLVSIFDVLDELRKSGITEEELDRARGVVRASADYLLDSPYELTEWFGRVEILDDPDKLLDPREEAKRFTTVQMDDVARVIADILRPTNRYLAVIGPVAWRYKRRLETSFRGRTRPPEGTA